MQIYLNIHLLKSCSKFVVRCASDPPWWHDMSDFLFSVGSTVCNLSSFVELSSGSCYDPDAMNVLGMLATFLISLAIGMWVLMRA